MTRGKSRTPVAVAAVREAGSVGNLAMAMIGGFQPIRSRWIEQPRLPELWLRENEGRRLREMTKAGRADQRGQKPEPEEAS